MRTIKKKTVVNAVARLVESAAHSLPQDMSHALRSAVRREKTKRAKRILSAIIKNAQIAFREHIPLCQDTGVAVAFCSLGSEVKIQGGTLEEAIQEGIRKGSHSGYLRRSIVRDPLIRKNTGTNAPGVVHIKTVRGRKLKLSVLLKGFGSENKSSVFMMNPTATEKEIVDTVVDAVRKAGADACPPYILGIGIGGTVEKACLLAKEALLVRIGRRNSNSHLARLERSILKRVNKLGIGPLGFKGKTTAIDVKIKTYPTHIAGLPIALSIGCHAHRHKEITL